MLQRIKSKIYTTLLYCGSIYFKDRHSKVIYYHDIHSNEENKCSEMSTPISLFMHHIHIIKSMGFEVVSEITKPFNQIHIQFDDGFRGIYKHKELLLVEKVFPTLFMITSRIGDPNYLTREELKDLKLNGFNIQSHTHTHKDLNTLNEEDLFSELSVSKIILEKNLENEITEICFPKGLFNDLVLKICKKVGYKKWYCSIPGNNQEQFIDTELKFRNLVQFSDPIDFKSIVLGGSKIFKNRYSKQHYGKKIYLS